MERILTLAFVFRLGNTWGHGKWNNPYPALCFQTAEPVGPGRVERPLPCPVFSDCGTRGAGVSGTAPGASAAGSGTVSVTEIKTCSVFEWPMMASSGEFEGRFEPNVAKRL